MHPASFSAILQLDYPDRLPRGHRNAPAPHRMAWGSCGPLARLWLLRIELCC